MSRSKQFAAANFASRLNCAIGFGHGVGLKVQNGALVIRDGYTHYPQKQREYRYFPKDANLPSRIVIVGGSGSISLAAMDWLSFQNVPLIRVDWRGEIQSIISNSGYSADPQKVASQQRAKIESLRISTDIIQAKIRNCIETLKQCFPNSPELLSSLGKLAVFDRQLLSKQPTNIASLLAIEGNAAFAYFSVWQTLEINWKGTGRLPIPRDWYRVGPRSSIARQKLKNRNATHPVNAMLNYGYGVLESQTRLAIIADGLDPTISYLHSEKKDRSGLVFDLMEPLRPAVDSVILDFVKKHIFHPSDFTLRSDGVCRINPELARRITLKLLEKISDPNGKINTRTIRQNDRGQALQLSKMQT